jgi:AraC-like DNA-binding protein
MTPQERERQRIQANREELVERATRATLEGSGVEPLPGLRFFRESAPTELAPSISDPALSVIAQGCKELVLGDERYHYDPYHYCLGTLELPVSSHVVEASPERPYLSIRLRLDLAVVGAVMSESGHADDPRPTDVKAMAVSPLDAGLLDAMVRLVRLIDTPDEASVLAPLITREIVYRLLLGQQGERLRHQAAQGGFPPPIARAINQLRENLDQPLRIEDVAGDLGMSVSGFYHHFKAVTAMSPLQFQKRLRLMEARRLMLSEHLDAAGAAYRVGYNDASHFNREYKRLFGLPPMRDVARLRTTAGRGPSDGRGTVAVAQS